MADARSKLLMPLKDLASNFDIDIAAELEEYIGELANLTFTIENNLKLNFAEGRMEE